MLADLNVTEICDVVRMRVIQDSCRSSALQRARWCCAWMGLEASEAVEARLVCLRRGREEKREKKNRLASEVNSRPRQLKPIQLGIGPAEQTQPPKSRHNGTVPTTAQLGTPGD